MIFIVTPIYALPVATIYSILWSRVTALRAANGTSISVNIMGL